VAVGVWQSFHGSPVLPKGLPFAPDGEAKLVSGLPSLVAREVIWAKGSVCSELLLLVLIVRPNTHGSPWEAVCL